MSDFLDYIDKMKKVPRGDRKQEANLAPDVTIEPGVGPSVEGNLSAFLDLYGEKQGSTKADLTDESGKPFTGIKYGPGTPDVVPQFNEDMWKRMRFALDNNISIEESENITNFLIDSGHLSNSWRDLPASEKGKVWTQAVKSYEAQWGQHTKEFSVKEPTAREKRIEKYRDYGRKLGFDDTKSIYDIPKAVKDWWQDEDRLWNEKDEEEYI